MTEANAEVSPQNPVEADLYAKFPLQIFDSAKGKIAFRDIVPDNPRENGGDTPLVTMVGWAMNQEVIGNTVKGLYELGQHTIPLDIKGGGNLSEFSMSPTGEIKRQAEILKEWILSRKEPKINIMGQSLATLTILALIEDHPEMAKRINSVILVSPMGISGKDSALGLIKRKRADDKRNSARQKTPEDKEIEPRVMRSFIESITRHPVRAAKEGLAMANADEYEILYALQRLGINVGVIQGFDDKLASKDRLFAQIGKGYKSTITSLDSLQETVDQQTEPFEPIQLHLGQKFVYEPSTKQPPPIDALRQTMGGHEITGPKKLAGTLIRVIDGLDNPLTLEQVFENQAEFRKSDLTAHSEN